MSYHISYQRILLVVVATTEFLGAISVVILVYCLRFCLLSKVCLFSL